MKILHTADLHLGVKNVKLSKEKASLLNDEALYNINLFFKLAQNVDVIMICGDLFHSASVRGKIVKTFFDAVKRFEKPVIYIEGNHDEKTILSQELPENFILLNQKKSYLYNGVNFLSSFGSESFDASQKNVLLLHGNVDSPEDNDFVDLSQYLNRGFDYIALGHIHSFRQYSFGKDMVVYPGCLFSNGFDECGEKGFVIYDTESKKVEFQVMPGRKHLICECEISGFTNTYDVLNAVVKTLSNIGADKKDFVRVILNGNICEDDDISIPVLKDRLDEFFYVEIIDKTKLKIDIEKIKSEKFSFKYEFIDLVEKSDLDDEEKRLISQVGIEALKGENISL